MKISRHDVSADPPLSFSAAAAAAAASAAAGVLRVTRYCVDGLAQPPQNGLGRTQTSRCSFFLRIFPALSRPIEVRVGVEVRDYGLLIEHFNTVATLGGACG